MEKCKYLSSEMELAMKSLGGYSTIRTFKLQPLFATATLLLTTKVSNV